MRKCDVIGRTWPRTLAANFNRKTDPLGKVTLNVEILESVHSERTQLLFGGFETDPYKNKWHNNC
jgi:hypothetical protein